jgi:hypothetical protein
LIIFDKNNSSFANVIEEIKGVTINLSAKQADEIVCFIESVPDGFSSLNLQAQGVKMLTRESPNWYNRVYDGENYFNLQLSGSEYLTIDSGLFRGL